MSKESFFWPKELKAGVVELIKQGLKLSEIRTRYPNVPKATIYTWRAELKKAYRKESGIKHQKLVLTPETIPVRAKPGPKPKQQEEEKKGGDDEKKKIILICSEDANQLIDVLKGIL